VSVKEKRKEYQRIWYLKNQEGQKLKRKKYYKEHKEEVLVRAKKYRDAVEITPQQREKNRKKARKYRFENKEKYKGYVLERRYGIGLEKYNEMLKNQDNKCPICGCFLEDTKNTHVDHCHETGTVRGILCRQCNLLLGHAKDDLNILQGAIKYLTRRLV
jgi:hypothetical protein